MPEPGLVAQRSSSWSRRLTRIELAILRLAVVAMAVLVVLCIARPSVLGVDFALGADRTLALLGAAVAYAANHALRALRLAVLVHEPMMRLRSVLRVHLLTAGTALLTPFRLGDLVRVRVVGVFVGSGSRGLVVVWLERALDVAVVAALLLVSRGGTSMELWSPLLLLSAAFVVVTVALVTVVPENLHAVSLYLVRRRGRGGLRLLRTLERSLLVLAEAPGVLRRKTVTLVLLTVLVWSAELITLALAVPALAGGPSQLAAGLLTLLSELASGAVAVLPGSGGPASSGGPGAATGGPYRLIVLGFLLAGGAAAGTLLFRSRASTLGRIASRGAPVRWTS